MRIITQKGEADIPHESVMVFVNYDEPSRIHASSVFDTFNDMPLGVYNNEKDAMYVMKCIRYNKRKGCEYFHMPSAEIVPVWRQEESEGGEL